MWSQQPTRERRRLRKAKSTNGVLRRNSEASHMFPDAFAGRAGARAAATLAYGQANAPVKIDQSSQSCTTRARHRPTSEGSHFARNRSKERAAHREHVCKQEQQPRTHVRVSKSFQSLATRASWKNLSLCGGNRLKHEHSSWGSVNGPATADSRASKPRASASVIGQKTYVGSPRAQKHLFPWDPAFNAVSPAGELTKSPTVSNERRAPGNSVEAEPTYESRWHGHQSLRRLRSVAVLTRRPYQPQLTPRADDSLPVIGQAVDQGTSSATSRHSVRSNISGSLRQIPGTLRKLYRRTFRDDSSFCVSSGISAREISDSSKKVLTPQNPEVFLHQGRQAMTAARIPSARSTNTSPRPPTPPPHLDHSALRPEQRRASMQRVVSAAQTSNYGPSNLTSWSDSGSDRTVLLQRKLCHSQRSVQCESHDQYSQGAQEYPCGQDAQAIGQWESSQSPHVQPSLDTQRKISFFLKKMDNAGDLEDPVRSADSNEEKPSLSSDSAYLGRNIASKHKAPTIRLLSLTGECDHDGSVASEQSDTEKPLMSPSIYSQEPTAYTTYPTTARTQEWNTRLSSHGVATVGTPYGAARWTLATERRTSQDTLPKTSNDWRLWASKKIAGLCTDTEGDNLKLDKHDKLKEPLADPFRTNLDLAEPDSPPATRSEAGASERFPSLGTTCTDDSGSFTNSQSNFAGDTKVTEGHYWKPTLCSANDTNASTGHESRFTLDKHKPDILKTVNNDTPPRWGQGAHNLRKTRSALINPSHKTPSGICADSEQSWISASPMSENFIRRIQRGPYATPSPVSSNAGSPKTCSRLPQVLNRLQNFENVRPGTCTNVLDTFVRSDANSLASSPDQSSPAFL